jgi:hypothetical protein
MKPPTNIVEMPTATTWTNNFLKNTFITPCYTLPKPDTGPALNACTAGINKRPSAFDQKVIHSSNHGQGDAQNGHQPDRTNFEMTHRFSPRLAASLNKVEIPLLISCIRMI